MGLTVGVDAGSAAVKGLVLADERPVAWLAEGTRPDLRAQGAELVERVESPHAVGILLAGEGPGAPLRLALEACRADEEPGSRPDALEFIRWWLSDEQTLRIPHAPREWIWTRT